MTRPPAGTSVPTPTRALLAYAAPGLPEAMLLYCASLVIPGFYATEMGLSTQVIGTVMVIARMFDALVDPVTGYLSDRTAHLRGGRKPWLVAGAIVCSIAVAFLYAPPKGVGGGYYLGWTMCLYLGWTMAIIPYDAWGADISSEYVERTRIFTYRATAYYLGSLLFLCSPFLGVSTERTFNADVLRFNAHMVAVLFLVTVPIALWFGPRGRAVQPSTAIGFWSILANVRGNRPMLLFLMAYSISGFSLGVFLALSYVFIVSYLKLPEAFPVILLSYAVATLVAVPIWLRVVRRVGKHRAWALGVFGDAVIYPFMALLTPGPASYVPALVLITISGFADAVSRVASDSLLGDVVDFDELRTGRNRAAKYYALKSVVTKANVALGGGFAFLTIGLFGYEPAAAVNDAHGVFGLLLTLLFIPSVLYVLAGLIMWRFPIDRRRQDIIRRRLDARRARTIGAPSVLTAPSTC
jgi:GPH family glycoside/pentoside/hexuronide:cation symporter